MRPRALHPTPILLADLAARIIDAAEHHVCAIKMNFHIILPLSAFEILQINKLAHSFGLQSIADIKLNDIEKRALWAYLQSVPPLEFGNR